MFSKKTVLLQLFCVFLFFCAYTAHALCSEPLLATCLDKLIPNADDNPWHASTPGCQRQGVVCTSSGDIHLDLSGLGLTDLEHQFLPENTTRLNISNNALPSFRVDSFRLTHLDASANQFHVLQTAAIGRVQANALYVFAPNLVELTANANPFVFCSVVSMLSLQTLNVNAAALSGSWHYSGHQPQDGYCILAQFGVCRSSLAIENCPALQTLRIATNHLSHGIARTARNLKYLDVSHTLHTGTLVTTASRQLRSLFPHEGLLVSFATGLLNFTCLGCKRATGFFSDIDSVTSVKLSQLRNASVAVVTPRILPLVDPAPWYGVYIVNNFDSLRVLHIVDSFLRKFYINAQSLSDYSFAENMVEGLVSEAFLEERNAFAYLDDTPRWQQSDRSDPLITVNTLLPPGTASILQAPSLAFFNGAYNSVRELEIAPQGTLESFDLRSNGCKRLDICLGQCILWMNIDDNDLCHMINKHQCSTGSERLLRGTPQVSAQRACTRGRDADTAAVGRGGYSALCPCNASIDVGHPTKEYCTLFQTRQPPPRCECSDKIQQYSYVVNNAANSLQQGSVNINDADMSAVVDTRRELVLWDLHNIIPSSNALVVLAPANHTSPSTPVYNPATMVNLTAFERYFGSLQLDDFSPRWNLNFCNGTRSPSTIPTTKEVESFMDIGSCKLRYQIKASLRSCTNSSIVTCVRTGFDEKTYSLRLWLIEARHPTGRTDLSTPTEAYQMLGQARYFQFEYKVLIDGIIEPPEGEAPINGFIVRCAFQDEFSAFCVNFGRSDIQILDVEATNPQTPSLWLKDCRVNVGLSAWGNRSTFFCSMIRATDFARNQEAQIKFVLRTPDSTRNLIIFWKMRMRTAPALREKKVTSLQSGTTTTTNNGGSVTVGNNNNRIRIIVSDGFYTETTPVVIQIEEPQPLAIDTLVLRNARNEVKDVLNEPSDVYSLSQYRVPSATPPLLVVTFYPVQVNSARFFEAGQVTVEIEMKNAGSSSSSSQRQRQTTDEAKNGESLSNAVSVHIKANATRVAELARLDSSISSGAAPLLFSPPLLLAISVLVFFGGFASPFWG